MISPRSIKEFLEKLNTAKDKETENELVESILNRLKNNNNTNNSGQATGSQEDDERSKQEENLRCRLYGILMAKIGDRFWEKHTNGQG